jgi:hypothetical protein
VKWARPVWHDGWVSVIGTLTGPSSRYAVMADRVVHRSTPHDPYLSFSSY